jgi:hypothetical protein
MWAGRRRQNGCLIVLDHMIHKYIYTALLQALLNALWLDVEITGIEVSDRAARIGRVGSRGRSNARRTCHTWKLFSFVIHSEA